MATDDAAEPAAEEFDAAAGFREDLPAFQEVFEAATTGPGHPAETADPGGGAGVVPARCSTAPTASFGWRCAMSSHSASPCSRGSGST